LKREVPNDEKSALNFHGVFYKEKKDKLHPIICHVGTEGE
jgi:hypothetical protein